MTTINLPRRQKELFDLLFGKGDVVVDDLFDAMRQDSTPAYDTTSARQRWLTPYIAMLNRSLEGHRLKVEPGQLKNTYRLVTTT